MNTNHKLILAFLLSAFSSTIHATQILTLEASGHLASGGDEAGFFGTPLASMGTAFIHTLRIDLDSCVTSGAYSINAWDCLTTSFLSMNGKTLTSPSNIGNFAIGPRWLSPEFEVTKRFDGGNLILQSIIQAELPATGMPAPSDWKTIRNFSISTAPNQSGNATYTYRLEYDDISIPQLMFTGETGFETLVINPIPEPSSLALVGLALIGLAFSRRQKERPATVK